MYKEGRRGGFRMFGGGINCVVVQNKVKHGHTVGESPGKFSKVIL